MSWFRMRMKEAWKQQERSSLDSGRGVHRSNDRSEGGFSPEEIAQLDKDMHRISLGRRILRTETAGMATLSMLIYELDI